MAPYSGQWAPFSYVSPPCLKPPVTPPAPNESYEEEAGVQFTSHRRVRTKCRLRSKITAVLEHEPAAVCLNLDACDDDAVALTWGKNSNNSFLSLYTTEFKTRTNLRDSQKGSDVFRTSTTGLQKITHFATVATKLKKKLDRKALPREWLSTHNSCTPQKRKFE